MKKKYILLQAFIITFGIFASSFILFVVYFVINNNNIALYLKDNPIKADSAFVVNVSYANGKEAVEEYILPADAELYIISNNGSYYLRYTYNANVKFNGYSDKLIKPGIMTFKYIK